MKRNEFVSRAEIEKKIQLGKIELAIEEATITELKAKGEVDRLEDELAKLIKGKRKRNRQED